MYQLLKHATFAAVYAVIQYTLVILWVWRDSFITYIMSEKKNHLAE
jgi:hypothetical protein